MSLDPVLPVFFDEAEELLRVFEEGVLELEATPHDREVLDSIFRVAHTLKGSSRMLGFERIATLAQALEALLARLRTGESAPGREVIDTLLAADDVLGDLVDRARADDSGDVPGSGALVNRLAEHAQSTGGHRGAGIRPSATAPGPAAPTDAEPALYAIRFEPPTDLLRRGLDPLRLIEALGALGELVRVEADPESLPPLANLEPEGSHLAFTAWLRTRAPRGEIEACFDVVDDPDAVRIAAINGEPLSPAKPAVASVGRGLEVGRATTEATSPWTAAPGGGPRSP